jgi:large subunit ribosomal protein L10
MPSNKVLEAKKQIVEDLAGKLQTAAAGVLVKYEGITVADDTALRTALRNAGIEYSVMKNTLTGRACEMVGYGDMKQYLSGMTAIAISQDDPIAPAKIMKEYADKIPPSKSELVSLTVA